jgi:hypothetical protein
VTEEEAIRDASASALTYAAEAIEESLERGVRVGADDIIEWLRGRATDVKEGRIKL